MNTQFDYIKKDDTVKDNNDFNSNDAISEFEKLSAERKESVARGDTPEFFITQGYMMFKRKYAYKNESVKEAYRRVAKGLAVHYLTDPELAEEKFFNLMWKGFLAPSTPVLNNTGLNRGDSVSCSGGYIGDSVNSFYTSLREAALLSQRGYGTSGYLGDIRPRGSAISTGGKASGVVPVFEDFTIMANKISQGSNRRGQWAGYLPISHGDFDELCDYILKNPTIANIGWCITDNDISKLKSKDPEMVRRWKQVMYIRARHGKGYLFKVDTANRLAPEPIKKSGFPILASNLCIEIMLPQSKNYSFSCVLSSLNLTKWFEFEEDTIYWSTIFLDCVVSATLKNLENVPELKTLYNFTRDFRAIGLGALGYHSLLQSKMLPFDSLEAKLLNKKIFKKIKEEATRASMDLAKLYSEPLHCRGTGMRNATLLAIAPNTSSALLAGGVSQGIEPLVANVYNQNTAAGEVTRMNPYLLKYLKDNNLYSKELLKDIATNHQGSIQHLTFLPEHVRNVFKTAFEINQNVIIEQASDRQEYICQGQSLNLFFTSESSEKEIAEITWKALLDERIKGLYYQRSMRSVRASNGSSECVACEA